MDPRIRYDNRYAGHTPYEHVDGQQHVAHAAPNRTLAYPAPPNPFGVLPHAPVRGCGGLPPAQPQRRLRRTGKIPMLPAPVIWQKQLVSDPSGDLKSLAPAGIIGKGGMGAIHILSTPSGKLFAGKESTAPAEYLMHEYEAMERIYATNPRKLPDNIILTYGMADLAFPGQGTKRLLLMERVDGKDGHDFMRKLAGMNIADEDKINVIKYTIDTLLNVVKRARDAGVVHCDLKPHNFMFDRNTGILKVIDWGGWAPVGGKPWTGTPGYVAPESRGWHIETVEWDQPVNVQRTVAETVTKKEKGIKGLLGKKKSYVKYKSIMCTEYRRFSQSVLLDRSVDERSDVYSIGIILQEMMRSLNVRSATGNSFCRKLADKDRGKRLDVRAALNDNFMRDMSEKKKARAMATVRSALA